MTGNKAQNLEKLQALGLNVPPFYEIDAETLSKLESPKVAQHVLAEYKKWCRANNCSVVAVRSSAEAEDTASQSFAGQYASIMGVEGDEKLFKALRIVSNSQPSLAYSDNQTSTINVIIQQYIEPDIAGVIFTVNPASGAPEMLVNAASGHGSKVVEGEESHSIHIDRITDGIRFADDSRLLTKSQVRQLRNLGDKVEQYTGSPQDIEWAFSGKKLYALQTRPITSIAHLQVWDNANIGESFPGIVLPLTFSISRRGYELVYKSQSYEAGLNWYQLEANHRSFHAMVGLFGGRMYYNLGNWYRFIGLFPNNSQNQKYLDEQLQTIGDAAYLPPNNYSLGYKLRFYSRIFRRTALFGYEKESYWNYLSATYKKYETMPVGNDLFLLLDRYKMIEQKVIPHMGRSADNDFFVMIYHGLLRSRLRHWFGENSPETSDFLGSLHDVISARQATLLAKIADAVNADKKAIKHLKNNDLEALDAHLLSVKAGKLIKEYRAKFLHRFAEDQKIEAVNPMLSLSGFYEMIKAYQQLDLKAVNSRRRQAVEAEQIRHSKIADRLTLPRKLIYKMLLGRLKHHLRIREHNRLLRGQAYAYLRELFIEAGAYLAERGLIDIADDIYYLDIEEIFRLTDGTGYNDELKNLVAARRQNYQAFSRLNVPSKFITTGLTNHLPAEFNKSWPVASKAQRSLPGTISSPGDIEGTVIVLEKPIIPSEPFDILVVSHTDPGWTPLIALAKGLIVEHGGILSHAAIVTRELGIPSIIGVQDATQQLKTGTKVRINTAQTAVEII